MDFTETEEQRALRATVGELAGRYGYRYLVEKARAGLHLDEYWHEAGKLGLLGVNLPERYGGGGAGMHELSLVLEESAAAGCGLMMMVVSPAICGTIIARYGTEAQRERWLPGIADGSTIMSFAITEPDAGSNSHRITTTARRDGDGWRLTGRKVYISGVDQAAAVLVVARVQDTDGAGARAGALRPALFVVPTDVAGFEAREIAMDLTIPDRQFALFLDDVALPGDALIGEQPDVALAALFAGLNPERIMAAAMSVGTARYALDKAATYVGERQVWGVPIGAHQGLSHPLAQIKIELELARLMMQKAASLHDAGRDGEDVGECANMAKYAAAEVGVRAVDQAIQCHGGNGLASEYGLGTLLGATRVARIAPVSREMVLNFVAQFSLHLPRSY